jgi:hypothetical protein
LNARLEQWGVLSNAPTNDNKIYPQILAQGNILHVAYSNNFDGQKISYVRSIDGGNNWEDFRILSDTINSYETVFAGISSFNSKLIVLWSNIFNQGYRNRNIGYSISEDNGGSWSGPYYVLNPNWEYIQYFASSSSGSVINIILNTLENQELVYYVVRSTDFGTTWSNPVELFQSAQNGTMDMTAYGDYFHFVWSGNFNEYDTWETYYIRSADAGITWSNNIPLPELGGEASFWPSIDTDDSGALAFCWTDYKYSPNWFTGDVFIRQSFDNGGYWTAEQQISFTHFSLWTDVCRWGDSIYVAWDDERYGAVGRTIYFVKSLDGGVNWTNEYRIEYDTSTSKTPALEASEDYIYLVWADDRCSPDTDICGGIYFTGYEDETGAEIINSNPTYFSILTAYPNPFNSKTILTYKNLKGGEIEIYNINGQKIKTFKTAEIKEGQIEWDARDALGNKVSS